MKRGFLFVIVLCCTMMALGAKIAVPAVKNPTFTDFKDGMPKDWSLKAYQGKYALAETDGGLRITLTDGGNVNLGQKIVGLDTKTTYKFSFSYRKGTSNPDCIPGLQVKVHPLKKNSTPTSPVWIMTNPVTGNEWQEASAIFTMPEGSGAVSIGFVCVAKRSNTEETIWIKDPKIEVESSVTTSAVTKTIHGVVYRENKYIPKNPQLKFTDAEMQKGIFSFVPADQDGLRPEYIPARSEINQELRLFSAQNAIINGNVALYPLKNWQNVNVSIDPFADPKTKISLESANIELRSVKIWEQKTAYRSFEYYRIPELLEEFSSLDLIAGEFKQLWLIIKIPANLGQAELHSTIRVSVGDQEIISIPIVCQVLDYNLQNNKDIRWGLYPEDGRWLKYNSEELMNELWRIYDQGINTLRLSAVSYLTLKEENGQMEVQLSPRWNEVLTDMGKIGFKGPYWINIQSLSGRIEKTVTSAVKDRDKLDSYFKQVINFLEADRKAHNYPEFIYQVTDEASSLDTRAINELKILRGMKLHTMCTVSYEADLEFLDLVDVRCYGGPPYNQAGLDIVNAHAKKSQAQNWWYGIGSYSTQEMDMAKNRAGAGIIHWKIGFSHVWAWTFQRVFGSPFDDFDAKSKDACITYPDPKAKRFIPTLAWQGILEGYNDYRYFYTLNCYISEAEKNNSETIRNAALRNEKMLGKIINSVPWDGLSVISNGTMQNYRYLVANGTLELKNMLAGNIDNSKQVKAPPEILSLEIITEPDKIADLSPEDYRAIIPFTKNQIVIDGDLDDIGWRNIKPFNLGKVDGEKPNKATKAYALYDDKFLYVAFDCEEPAMDKLQSIPRAEDSKDIAEDDCVEIFLDKDHRHVGFYQIVINSAGSVLDYEFNKNAGSDTLATVAKNFTLRRAVKKNTKGYSVEVAIPIAEIGSLQNLWGINFCRESRSSETEISSWAPTYGFFAKPERFGHVILEPQGGGIVALKLKEQSFFGRNSFIFDFKELAAGTPVTIKEKNNKIAPSTDGELGLLSPGTYEFQIALDKYFSANYPVNISEKIKYRLINPVIGNENFIELQIQLQLNRSMRKNLTLELKCINEDNQESAIQCVPIKDDCTNFTVKIYPRKQPGSQLVLKAILKQGNDQIIELAPLSFWVIKS